MRLKVVAPYGARHPLTGEDVAWGAGDHVDADDWLGEYLLRDAPGCFERAEAPEDGGGDGDGDGLDLLGRPALLEIAVAEHVDGVGSRTRRQELIDAIRAGRAAAPPGDAPAPAGEDGAGPVLVGYGDDGSELYGARGEDGSVGPGASPSQELAEAVAAWRLGVDGLESIEERREDGGEWYVLHGGDADGFSVDSRRPAAETLRRWLLAADGSLAVGDLDRDGLARTIRELSEDG